MLAPREHHNAGFDIAFLNAELKRAGKPPIEARGSLVSSKLKKQGPSRA
jgi:DNA polymerase III epsilon subunit-like protein